MTLSRWLLIVLKIVCVGLLLSVIAAALVEQWENWLIVVVLCSGSILSALHD